MLTGSKRVFALMGMILTASLSVAMDFPMDFPMDVGHTGFQARTAQALGCINTNRFVLGSGIKVSCKNILNTNEDQVIFECKERRNSCTNLCRCNTQPALVLAQSQSKSCENDQGYRVSDFHSTACKKERRCQCEGWYILIIP